jgi:hypothetical protein
VYLNLTDDEALVLHDLLWRFAETNELSLAHNAEFIALSSISAQLDRELVAPFQDDYRELVDAARARLAHGFEGRAPGVGD